MLPPGLAAKAHHIRRSDSVRTVAQLPHLLTRLGPCRRRLRHTTLDRRARPLARLLLVLGSNRTETRSGPLRRNRTAWRSPGFLDVAPGCPFALGGASRPVRLDPDESGTTRRLDNGHGRPRLGRTGRDGGAADALRVTVGHQRGWLHHGAGRGAQQDQEQESERSR
ncbi:hypothetical protein GCM10010308_67650 [Streptomyces vinaceusdrappus]|nr:hypothetical protein GCM10010308_67650 [Streptomyces vinaceusdrappus]